MPRESNDPLFAHFDSEQHRLWKQDRLLRQAVPLAQAWRGCLGLAMLLSHVEQTEYPTDRHALIPNACVTWLALRDVPRNHFPACPAMNRRGVHYANTARAELHHGMPVIDFTREVRDAWDLRFMPIGRYGRVVGGRGDVLNSDERPVEFAVLNRLSAAMTRFACCAVDVRGCPLRRPWAAARPKGWAKCSPSLPGQWMPRAYLAFGRKHSASVQAHARTSGLTLEADAGIALFPAERVGRVVREHRPVGLWWDLQPGCKHVDGQLEAASFPPIPLAAWDRLRFALPGDALLDARIAGPRLSTLPLRSTRATAEPSVRPLPRLALSIPLSSTLSMAG